MTKEMKQPKFTYGHEVRESDGNSLSTKYEVLNAYWWKANSPTSRDGFKYTLCNVTDPEHVITKHEYELKDANELCPYEVYGNMMVGKTIKSVDFNSDSLVIIFEDDYVSKFSADCCQNFGYLGFEGH
jgi:hypothetical protein